MSGCVRVEVWVAWVDIGLALWVTWINNKYGSGSPGLLDRSRCGSVSVGLALWVAWIDKCWISMGVWVVWIGLDLWVVWILDRSSSVGRLYSSVSATFHGTED